MVDLSFLPDKPENYKLPKTGGKVDLSFLPDQPTAQTSGQAYLESYAKELPDIMQGIGGLAGSPGGYASMSTSGTLGRMMGRLYTTAVLKTNKDPVEYQNTMARMNVNPFYAFSLMDDQELKKFKNEFLTTAGIETVTGLLAKGLDKILTKTGGILIRKVFGQDIFERASQVGWKEILKEKYRGKNAPKWLVNKIERFIPRVKNVAGRKVSKAIADNDVIVSTSPIKENIKNIYGVDTVTGKPIGRIDDLDISTVQKNRLKNVLRRISGLPKQTKISELWKIRKDVDDLRYGLSAISKKGKTKSISKFSFSQEGKEYLDGIRRILNEPVKNASPEIATAFNVYQKTLSTSDSVSKYFVTEPTLFDNVLTAEKFKLGGVAKDPARATQIRSLETLLNADDKVLDDMLSRSANIALQTKSTEGGIFRTLIEENKRNIARGSQFFRSKMFKVPKATAGRMIPTGMSKFAANEIGVTSPEGIPGIIPKDSLQEALNRGFVLNE